MRALWRALPCIRLIGTPIEPSQKVPLSPLRRPFSKKTRLARSGLNSYFRTDLQIKNLQKKYGYGKI